MPHGVAGAPAPLPAGEIVLESMRRSIADALCSDPRYWTYDEKARAESSVALRMRRIFRQARADGILVERALVLLKAAWANSPPRHLIPTGEQGAALNRLVTLCINAYFDDEVR